MVTLVNRAKMSTSATGTGTITLGSAETGYQSFADAGVADGDVVRYVIEDGDDWEIGSGTYTATGTTLTRTVDESSNADAALNLTGSAVVFITAAAGDVFQGELFAENPSSPTAPNASGTNAVAIGTSAVASGLNAMAFGEGSTASGDESLALGDSGAVASNAVAIGPNAYAAGVSSTSIGANSDARSTGSTAIGYNSQAFTGSNATALTNSYASGADSLAAAIANNTSSYGATGANSIAMGYQSKATSGYGVAIGRSCQAGDTGFATGSSALATGAKAFSHGLNTTASEAYSIASGREALANIEGKAARASGKFAAQGDAQSGTFVLRSDTTDATAEALTTNNSTASTDNQIILPNNSAYSFSGTIIARESAAAGSDYASWEIKGALLRDGTAASTVLGNGIVNKLYATSGASAWAVALSADTTNGGLKVEVTGAAATNIRWVATVNTSEVTYA